MARARTAGRRPDYEWVTNTFNQRGIDLAVGTDDHVLLLGTVTPSTLMRIRGKMSVQLDTAAVDETGVIAAGIIIVGQAAQAAGTASLPKPSDEGPAPWIWHQFFNVTSGSEAAMVNDFLVETVEIDSKAMRKIHNDEQIVLVCSSAIVTDQGGTWDYFGGVRMLIAK